MCGCITWHFTLLDRPEVLICCGKCSASRLAVQHVPQFQSEQLCGQQFIHAAYNHQLMKSIYISCHDHLVNGILWLSFPLLCRQDCSWGYRKPLSWKDPRRYIFLSLVCVCNCDLGSIQTRPIIVIFFANSVVKNCGLQVWICHFQFLPNFVKTYQLTCKHAILLIQSPANICQRSKLSQVDSGILRLKSNSPLSVSHELISDIKGAGHSC